MLSLSVQKSSSAYGASPDNHSSRFEVIIYTSDLLRASSSLEHRLWDSTRSPGESGDLGSADSPSSSTREAQVSRVLVCLGLPISRTGEASSIQQREKIQRLMGRLPAKPTHRTVPKLERRTVASSNVLPTPSSRCPGLQWPPSSISVSTSMSEASVSTFSCMENTRCLVASGLSTPILQKGQGYKSPKSQQFISCFQSCG